MESTYVSQSLFNFYLKISTLIDQWSHVEWTSHPPLPFGCSLHDRCKYHLGRIPKDSSSNDRMDTQGLRHRFRTSNPEGYLANTLLAFKVVFEQSVIYVRGNGLHFGGVFAFDNGMDQLRCEVLRLFSEAVLDRGKEHSQGIKVCATKVALDVGYRSGHLVFRCDFEEVDGNLWMIELRVLEGITQRHQRDEGGRRLI